VSDVGWQEKGDYSITKLSIEELGDDHSVICHKHFSVFEPRQLLEKLKSKLFIVDDPIRSNALNLNCVRFVT